MGADGSRGLLDVTEPGRTYAGRSNAERRADRRERLLDAGLELLGTVGWQATSIERLCATASVATRAFYDSFGSREDLLREVYDGVVASTVASVLAATGSAGPTLSERIEAGVAAYVQHLTEDPRRLTVVYREARALPSLAAHRHEAMVGFAAVLEQDLSIHVLPPDPGRRRVLTLALAGAVCEVLLDWLDQPVPRPPLAPVLQELRRLFAVALVDRGSDQNGAAGHA